MRSIRPRTFKTVQLRTMSHCLWQLFQDTFLKILYRTLIGVLSSFWSAGSHIVCTWLGSYMHHSLYICSTKACSNIDYKLTIFSISISSLVFIIDRFFAILPLQQKKKWPRVILWGIAIDLTCSILKALWCSNL